MHFAAWEGGNYSILKSPSKHQKVYCCASETRPNKRLPTIQSSSPDGRGDWIGITENAPLCVPSTWPTRYQVNASHPWTPRQGSVGGILVRERPSKGKDPTLHISQCRKRCCLSFFAGARPFCSLCIIHINHRWVLGCENFLKCRQVIHFSFLCFECQDVGERPVEPCGSSCAPIPDVVLFSKPKALGQDRQGVKQDMPRGTGGQARDYTLSACRRQRPICLQC